MSRTVAPPHDLWTVARVDAVRLTGAERAELIDWVSGVSGLSVAEVREYVLPVALVSQSEQDRRYRLHLSRFVRDAEDRLIVDHAADHLQTEPLVYEITDYPAWLPGVSHQQSGGA